MQLDVNLNVSGSLPIRLVPDRPPASLVVLAVRDRAAPPFHPRPGDESVLTLLDSQKTTLHFHDGDAAGNDVGLTDLAAPPAWTVDPPGSVSLTPSADGMMCELSATNGPVAAGTVTAKAVTKEGVALAPTLQFAVTLDVATTATITADPPVSRLGP